MRDAGTMCPGREELISTLVDSRRDPRRRASWTSWATASPRPRPPMKASYGDSGHHHFVQPQSLQPQVQFANTVATKAARRVCFISFTVPQDRDNESYFAPLAGLQRTNELDLSFGIVPYHPQDQARGTTARQVQQIEASLPPGTEWALGTECGMGRTGLT